MGSKISAQKQHIIIVASEYNAKITEMEEMRTFDRTSGDSVN